MDDSSEHSPGKAASVVIAGMHYSGAAVAASLLRAAGLGLSPDSPEAGDAPSGSCEDPEVVELQREMLFACTVAESGWRDWGWTESQRLDFSQLPSFRPRAEALVRRLQAASGGRPWGWTDPRTTLLLAFWDEIVPDARYVFVYRAVWEVAPAIAALRRPPFLEAPGFVPRIWRYYNRQLLDFYRRHRDRCLLLEAGAVRSRPREALALVRSKLGVDLAEAPDGVAALSDPRGPGGRDDPAAAGLAPDSGASTGGLWRLSSRLYPREAQLWSELEQTADLAAEREADAAPAAGVAGAAGDEPTFAVVVPCFNQGEYLLAAVASAEDSEGAPLELVIVDDGSTDPFTVEVLGRLRGAGYQVIEQRNHGLSAARNAGVGAARGRYVLPLDADNCIRPSYLRRAAEIMDAAPDVGVVYGDAALSGRRSGLWRMPDFDLDEMATGNRVDACGIYRREVWRQCGGYDEDVELGWEDWDFWLSAAEHGWRFVHVPEVMFDYRVAGDSPSASGARQEHRRQMLELIVAKHPAVFQPRLPRMFAEKDAHWLQAEARAAQLERTRDELSAGLEAAGRDLQGTREELHAVRAELAATRDALEAARSTLDATGRELVAVHAELGRFRQRVDFMAGTRAWRLRSGLLRLRQALGPRRPA